MHRNHISQLLLIPFSFPSYPFPFPSCERLCVEVSPSLRPAVQDRLSPFTAVHRNNINCVLFVSFSFSLFPFPFPSRERSLRVNLPLPFNPQYRVSLRRSHRECIKRALQTSSLLFIRSLCSSLHCPLCLIGHPHTQTLSFRSSQKHRLLLRGLRQVRIPALHREYID